MQPLTISLTKLILSNELVFMAPNINGTKCRITNIYIPLDISPCIWMKTLIFSVNQFL